MIKNYFFLNRFVIESQSIIINQKVHSVFSQEKEKLLIEIGNDKTSFIEINVNPSQPYITIIDSYSRAKKNTINLFPELENQTIESFKIATDDRILRLKSGDSFLFFAIRGKFTNVIFVHRKSSIQSFKKSEEADLEKMWNEFSKKEFNSDFNIPELQDLNDNFELRTIGKNFPIISKEIIWEAERRISKSKAHSIRILKEVIDEISYTKPSVFINEEKTEVHLAVETFKNFNFNKIETFNSLISAQTYFLSKKYYYEEKAYRQKIIQKYFDRESKKISNKINNLQGVIDRGSKEEEYNKIGNLLLINLKKIKPGQSELIIEDIYSGNSKLKIKLDPKISAKNNVDKYFDKAKSEKISFQKSKELLDKAIKDLNKLKDLYSRIAKIESIKELDLLMKEFKLKPAESAKDKEDISLKFKRYIIEGKYNVYVGKDSKNNDLLTTRFAKQNDYWFHARSVSGSHVVLRIENTKEIIPKNILKKVAALAAFHSKAKTSGLAPVSYTFKKYVVKKKGFPAGTVHLLREDNLLVKPEIPDNCEYVEKD